MRCVCTRGRMQGCSYSSYSLHRIPTALSKLPLQPWGKLAVLPLTQVSTSPPPHPGWTLLLFKINILLIFFDLRTPCESLREVFMQKNQICRINIGKVKGVKV